jgi:sulfur-oxidizing protein SoxY
MKVAVLLSVILLSASAVQAAELPEDQADRMKRWKDLSQQVFGDKKLENGAKFIAIDAPDRAMDAALVPIGVKISGKIGVKALYLLVDDNPVPLAAHFTFGPAADPKEMKIRIRLEQYTYIHAVVEGGDGKLYQAARFVKAAGGCSAPAGPADQALKDLGAMKLQTMAVYAPGKTMEVQLHIRHPNFNGMQMDQVTRYYTPARFINQAEVSYDGQQVFHFEGGISMSSDPAITFGFKPREKGELTVVAQDSKETVFEHVFPIPQAEAATQ